MDATLLENLNSTVTASLTGTVTETIGMAVSVADFPAPVGAVVRIERDGGEPCDGEVVGFRDGWTLVYLQTPRPVFAAATACGCCVRIEL